MRLIAIFVLTLASTYALPAEEYEFMSEFPVDGDAKDIMLLAQSAVDGMRKSGAKDKDCRDLAKTMCKEVTDTISTAKKELREIYSRHGGSSIGSKCSTVGDSIVTSAETEVTTRKRVYDKATAYVATLVKKEIKFTTYTFEQMKDGKCGWAYKDSAYEKVRTEYVKAMRKENTEKGRWEESKRAVITAKKTRTNLQHKCRCEAKEEWERWGKSAETKTASVERNDKMCKMMKCVLDGTPHSDPRCGTTIKKLTRNHAKITSGAKSVTGCGAKPWLEKRRRL